MDKAVNKGYLLENFRLFHLKDRRAPAVEVHYHEFDKLVVLFSGAVDYTVEGALYRMCPGDILLVRHHEIHRPVISPDEVYERAVLWVNPEFLLRQQAAESGETLELCFSSARRGCLYRPAAEEFSRIRRMVLALEQALNEEGFGSALLADACFTQLFVALNRMVLRAEAEMPRDVDREMGELLQYIHTHLAEPLRVDTLAEACFLSRYYLMHRFKQATGYTLHAYISQKRLTTAAERLDAGMGIMEAGRSVGFSDYSSFLRAFRKGYGMTPGDYQKRDSRLEQEYRE